MFIKVTSVNPKDNYVLEIEFENRIMKQYDIKPLFEKWDIFNNLRDTPGLYRLVKVDPGGYGISWNDEIDLACDELWENGSALSNE